MILSRVKINKWQGEACFELKRVEAPLAKSSIVRSYAFNPKQALFSLILALLNYKPSLEKWDFNVLKLNSCAAVFFS